jgi:hypothetical protein
MFVHALTRVGVYTHCHQKIPCHASIAYERTSYHLGQRGLGLG